MGTPGKRTAFKKGTGRDETPYKILDRIDEKGPIGPNSKREVLGNISPHLVDKKINSICRAKKTEGGYRSGLVH